VYTLVGCHVTTSTTTAIIITTILKEEEPQGRQFNPCPHQSDQ